MITTAFAAPLKQPTSRLGELISNCIMTGELLARWLCMRQIDRKLFGYSRDCKGRVMNYHTVAVANTLHTLSGGGGNMDQYVCSVYEAD